MYFERKAYKKLLEWKEKYAEKYAVLLEGARRVGKSTIAEEFAMKEETINGAIQEAVKLAKENHISGEKNTPFLLSKVCEITNGASLRTNIEIVRNNAKTAALIAKAYCEL